MDYAVYLPAISSFYGTYIAKQRLEEFIPKDRIPAGFDRGIEGMNFLNEEEGYFTYKYGLYSAGHATLDLNKTMTKESMIQLIPPKESVITTGKTVINPIQPELKAALSSALKKKKEEKEKEQT